MLLGKFVLLVGTHSRQKTWLRISAHGFISLRKLVRAFFQYSSSRLPLRFAVFESHILGLICFDGFIVSVLIPVTTSGVYSTTIFVTLRLTK